MKTILAKNQIEGLRQREAEMRRWATAQFLARSKLADPRPNRHTRRALEKLGRVLRRFPAPAKTLAETPAEAVE